MVHVRGGVVLGVSFLIRGALAALPPIEAKGQHFFFSNNGSQFFMRGVAYQQELQNVESSSSGSTSSRRLYHDPLADVTACRRDVPKLSELRTNTIRVYAIDPTADHRDCMKLLDDAGIYVIADLSSPDESIIRTTPSWDLALFKRYTDVIDELSQFSNVLGFFAGNEVTNSNQTTEASAFVKAAVRDTKAYIRSKNLGRWLGVGYATDDHPDIRQSIATYFNCGPQEQAVDFWGYNIYSWCGQSSFELSGFDKRTEEFRDYSVPAFFAEYGCNTMGGRNRLFTEVETLYSDRMTGVWSGGIVYMYFQEANDYGLVEINNGQASELQPSFDNLASQVARSGYPTGVSRDSYQPSNRPRACPAESDVWRVSERLPPAPNPEVCDCMVSSARCRPANGIATDGQSAGWLIDAVCGQDREACADVNTDSLSGSYGLYSMCNATHKAVAVLDRYYRLHQSMGNACDFGGNATLVSSPSPASSCSSLLQSASAAPGGSAGGSGSGNDSGVGGLVVASSVLVSMLLGTLAIVM